MIRTLQSERGPRAQAKSAWRRRRGAAIILAMALVAGTMVLSYALLGSQSTSLVIQRNTASRMQAYQAAMTGLAAGLRQMHHDQEWNGTGSSFSGNLSATESYQVTFITGDEQLTENHPDYEWWPLRVTIRSEGKAVDPGNGARYTTHTAEAIVQLVPPAISPDSALRPQRWNEPQGFTVYQWNDLNFKIELPIRIEGRTRIQGALQLCQDYPPVQARILILPTVPARQRYLEHLNLLRLQQGLDYRPFGPDASGDFALQLATNHQSGDALEMLGTYLGLNYSHRAAESPPNWSSVTAPQTYRLYPGGETYQVPTLTGTVQNAYPSSGVLKTDPRENPLGLFYRSGNLKLQDNVNLQGTLLVTGELDIRGSNVTLSAKPLPWLQSTADMQVRLPTTIAMKVIYSAHDGELNGLVHAGTEFNVSKGPQSAALTLLGRVQANQLTFNGRHGLDSVGRWNATGLYVLFDPNPLYPLYCEDFFDPQPKIVLRPPAEALDYHWQDFSLPLLNPAPGEGLQWDLVRIADDVKS